MRSAVGRHSSALRSRADNSGGVGAPLRRVALVAGKIDVVVELPLPVRCDAAY